MVVVSSGERPAEARVAIVGGGISGLAAAHFLASRTRARVLVLEAEARIGGKVLTRDLGGIRVEAGPDGFLADAGLLALCRELGLEQELVEALTTRAYFWEADGELRPLAPPDMRHAAVTGRAPTRFLALRGGLDSLMAALARSTPHIEVRTKATVRSLREAPGGVVLTLEAGGTLQADAVVLAVPAHQVARLLADVRPVAADALAAIRYLDLGVIALRYPGQPWQLDGSGFLAAERPDRIISGCTWASAKWPHLAGGEDTVLRATVGGSGSRTWAALDDQALVAAVHRDLVAALGPAPAPAASVVTRWPQGIPDHRFRDPAGVQQARVALADSRVLLTAGGYLGGGMASCVADAAQVADAMATLLAVGAPA